MSSKSRRPPQRIGNRQPQQPMPQAIQLTPEMMAQMQAAQVAQQPPPPPQQNGGQAGPIAASIGQRIGEALKNRAAQGEAMQQNQQPQPQIPPQNQLITKKPDSQTLCDGFIAWTWKFLDGMQIVATYYQNDDVASGAKAGDYDVEIRSDSNDLGSLVMGSQEAREVGVLLLSAVEWEEKWPNFMGEFFKAGMNQQFVPRPPQQVVDADPVVVQVDDNGEVEDITVNEDGEPE